MSLRRDRSWSFATKNTQTRRSRRNRNRAQFEVQLLEHRRLLSNDLVVSVPGDGMSNSDTPDQGTLRWAIDQANLSHGADSNITFSVASVTPTSPLPTLEVPVTITGAVTINNFGLTLNGGNSTVQNVTIKNANDTGLYLTGTNNELLGDQIYNSSAWGVILSQAPDNTVGGDGSSDANVISGNQQGGLAVIGDGSTQDVVEGNFIGTDASGMQPMGNAYSGVYVGDGSLCTPSTSGSASQATIENNIIAGNDSAQSANGGIVIYGDGASGNVIQGNQIGVNVAGQPLPNQGIGIDVFSGASGNTIGGTSSSDDNVVASNTGDGIDLTGSGTDGNLVEGNFIGVNGQGGAGAEYGNGGSGIFIATPNNTIGGTTPSAANVIASNTGDGIDISGSGSEGNLVEGNFIGVNAQGAGGAEYANGGSGVVISAPSNTIGGATPTASNVIAQNQGSGVSLFGQGTNNNLIEGNDIGTNTGSSPGLANGSVGVEIDSGAQNNTFGGTTRPQGNLISGNQSSGVVISGSGSSGNVLESNSIGTDSSGSSAIGNNYQGILIDSGASGNSIGGVTGFPNIISGNNGDGIDIEDAGTSNNVILLNVIGDASNGAVALPNTGVGVSIFNGASNNTIGGGSADGTGNVISGNQSSGISISGGGTSGNVVAGNLIGTDVSGSNAIGNNNQGVLIDGGASGNTIGGAGGASNIISGNNGDGIDIQDAGTSNNVVSGNIIGTDDTGTVALANAGTGVSISNGASGNTIGGSTTAVANLISGNQGDGVDILGYGTTANVVAANWIGTNYDGSVAISNTGSGVNIWSGASNNTIGGPADTDGGNVILGNQSSGVVISGDGTSGNVLQGNLIGTYGDGSNAIGNNYQGILIAGGASGNTIGGTIDGQNVISGNNGDGIDIQTSGTSDNVVSNNAIGTNESGSNALANTGSGVSISNAASNNTIGGGSNSGLYNIISGNQSAGVVISGISTSEHVVSCNRIGTNDDESHLIDNTYQGVPIDGDASANTIGGAGSALNVISGNGGDGIDIQGAETTDNVVFCNAIGTNAYGEGDIGNFGTGVSISDGASDNTIGGSADGGANVISANLTGVVISGDGTSGNVLQGNLIGTDGDGADAIGNGDQGILIVDGASGNTIGGAADNGNVISGNDGDGIDIQDAGTSQNVVSGNSIGTNVYGDDAVANGGIGVTIWLGASNNTIGGTADDDANLISGNDSSGISISGQGTSGNVVEGNRIGTDLLGSTRLETAIKACSSIAVHPITPLAAWPIRRTSFPGTTVTALIFRIPGQVITLLPAISSALLATAPSLSPIREPASASRAAPPTIPSAD